jgi:putative DNA primase/helicase
VITASPIGTVIERLDGIERHGSQIAAKCPAHDDRTASLSIAEGDDGRVLLNCHAGCDTRAIVSALGLQMSDLFPPRTGASPASPTTKTKKTPTIHRSADRAIGAAEWSIEQKLGKTPQRAGEWVYHNLDRSEFARMVRFDLGDEKKEFRPVHSVAGGWQVGDPKGKFPLYRLPDICDAETVWIGEGEK